MSFFTDKDCPNCQARDRRIAELTEALRGLITAVEQTRVYAFSKGAAFGPRLSIARTALSGGGGEA